MTSIHQQFEMANGGPVAGRVGGCVGEGARCERKVVLVVERCSDIVIGEDVQVHRSFLSMCLVRLTLCVS